MKLKVQTMAAMLCFCLAFAIPAGSVSAAPIRNQAGTIDIEQAKQIAVADAGFTNAQITLLEAKEDIDDGIRRYEIGFIAENMKFSYEIDAQTGAIHQATAKLLQKPPMPKDGRITAEEAKAIALGDAGLTASDVRYIMVKLEKDDGRDIYEVEFLANGMQHSYEIDAGEGVILERETEAD